MYFAYKQRLCCFCFILLLSLFVAQCRGHFSLALFTFCDGFHCNLTHWVKRKKNTNKTQCEHFCFMIASVFQSLSVQFCSEKKNWNRYWENSKPWNRMENGLNFIAKLQPEYIEKLSITRNSMRHYWPIQ